MRKAGLLCSLALGIVVVFFGGWALTYPSPDPKSIKYVLWKADLYRLNLDEATGTMVGDPHRDALVVGKSKAQLRSKFGSLLPPADASPYLRGCYQNSSWNDREVTLHRAKSVDGRFRWLQGNEPRAGERVRRSELCYR
jgi:hypothetical protein